ncbi:MAG: hypothetical protein IT293_00035 [Deltaproteobacteria bacterium]|nr:hypothetical protein [Deltaproteobacteria bacterium]
MAAPSPPESVDPFETLNQSCHCIAVDAAKLRGALESSALTHGIYDDIRRDRPHLFSSSPVFLARAHLDRIARIVAALETVIASAPFGEWTRDLAPPIAHRDPGPRGVFLGYDFHLGRRGPALIEINTNAGGALLNTVLATAQQACCADVETVLGAATSPAALGDAFLAMFRAEWRRQRGDAPLGSIAIVDEAPAEQYLYPEFLLFQELFRRAGLRATVTDVAALRHEGSALVAGGERIDLVYNRLTDFLLATPASAALRAAYEAGHVVLTPNPHAWARYADKRHLTVFSDPERLRGWGVAQDAIAVLADGVPRTIAVDPARADELWRDRKRWFFKPVEGYGSKAAYRGDKLTRGTWDAILARPYVAQEIVPPSERTIRIEDREVPLKLDVRAYVYDGAVQLTAARLYQGQTTNFRTAGGGFAPVFTERAS